MSESRNYGGHFEKWLEKSPVNILGHFVILMASLYLELFFLILKYKNFKENNRENRIHFARTSEKTYIFCNFWLFFVR